jgi:hypothetical protein
MKTSRARIATFFALSLAAALPADTLRNHFDSDGMMRPPGFFDFVVVGSQGNARWLILSDTNPPSAPYIVSQTELTRPADAIAMALRRNQAFQDGSIATFVKRSAGRAGLVLRMSDERNFLVLLVNTATGEAVLSSYRDGKPSELGRGQASLARAWEEFGVTASGAKVTVLFNDVKLFEAIDPAPASGRTGLATAGPGDARFDEFVIDAIQP